VNFLWNRSQELNLPGFVTSEARDPHTTARQSVSSVRPTSGAAGGTRTRLAALQERSVTFTPRRVRISWGRSRESNPHLLRTRKPCEPSTLGRHSFILERKTGVEPVPQAWRACAQPLSHIRLIFLTTVPLRRSTLLLQKSEELGDQNCGASVRINAGVGRRSGKYQMSCVDSFRELKKKLPGCFWHPGSFVSHTKCFSSLGCRSSCCGTRFIRVHGDCVELAQRILKG